MPGLRRACGALTALDRSTDFVWQGAGCLTTWVGVCVGAGFSPEALVLLWAHRACVRLLPGVGPLVRRNGALLAEPHWAHQAGVRLLPGMGRLVRRNGALLAEPHKKINASGSMQIFPQCHLGSAWFCRHYLHWAHRAGVRLLARVGPLVRRNGALLAEPLWAHRASVRLLPGMVPLVRRNGALLALGTSSNRVASGRCESSAFWCLNCLA